MSLLGTFRTEAAGVPEADISSIGGARLRGGACHPTVDLGAKRNKIDWFR
jgi:hypothetical protein